MAFVAAVALITCAARADGYWPQPSARTQGPLPWTGPYVGLNAGYAWHNVDGVYNNADLSDTEQNSAIVGWTDRLQLPHELVLIGCRA